LESGALVAAGVAACPAGVLAPPAAGGAPLFSLLFLFLSMSSCIAYCLRDLDFFYS